MPAPAPHATVAAELSLAVGGRSLAGARRVELLRQIDRLGSITQAAKAAGLSYKGAWDAIQDMNNVAGEALVDRMTGGRGGGYTRLTERGVQLLGNFERIQQEHARFVARLNQPTHGLQADQALVEGIALRTSARNQFAGTVSALRRGSVNDEITLDVIGAQRIVATITSASRLDLGLEIGARAYALIKASSVVLATARGSARLSASNQLDGRIARVTRGSVNSEVAVELPGGGTVVAIVTTGSVQAMGLRKADAVTAIFRSSSVIVGTPC